MEWAMQKREANTIGVASRHEKSGVRLISL